MYIGIDVGGTYTDGVLIKEKSIYRKVKLPTQKTDLVSSLLAVLDHLIKDIDLKEVQKVVFSTTLITNLVVENKLDPVSLILIPGDGIPLRETIFKKTFVQEVPGAIDYRGREIKPLDISAVQNAIENISNKGFNKIAVAGKFAQRNNSHELKVADLIRRYNSNIEIELSHKVNGELNYGRRIASTILSLATKKAYTNFVQNVQESLAKRAVVCPAYVLKADGGTLPLNKSVECPIETVFSGPAAGLLGTMALTPYTEGSVVLDIGGTTTDIGFILDNQHPVLASKGADINGYLTQVRAFQVRAVPIGGDSHIEVKDGSVRINRHRIGPAYCMGGPGVTPTDALSFLDLIDIGCKDKAAEGLRSLGAELNQDPKVLAKEILHKVITILQKEIDEMYQQWQLEPAYRIWEMKNKRTKVHRIIGSGGGSQGIINLLGKVMNCETITLSEGSVANAIGAALAVPTPTVTLRVDTEQGFYSYLEKGVQDLLPRGFRDEDVINLAKHLLQVSQKPQNNNKTFNYEIIRNESFSIIRGNHRVGKIVLVKLQFPWDIELKLYEEGDFTC